MHFAPSIIRIHLFITGNSKRTVFLCDAKLSGWPGESGEKVEQVKGGFPTQSFEVHAKSKPVAQHPIRNGVENTSQTFMSETVQSTASS